jgi:hypothetical protein
MSFKAPESPPQEKEIPTLEVATEKPIPTLEAVETDEDAAPDDLLDAIPVAPRDQPTDTEPDENENRSLPVPQLDPSVWIIANRLKHTDLTLHQRIVYSLLLHSFTTYTDYVLETIVGLGMVPFVLALTMVLGFLVVFVTAWIAGLVSGVVGSWIGYLVYALPLFVVWIGWMIAKGERDALVGMDPSDRPFQRFKLGRLEMALHITSPVSLMVFFGAAFGMQAGLLYCAADHGGLGTQVEVGFWQAWLWTLDNFGHGIFVHTAELWDVRLGPKVEHNNWSATVYFVFRLGYEAMILLFFIGLYQRWKLRHFFRRFPSVNDGVDALPYWVQDVCGNKQHWPRRFCDEFLFLALAAAYIRGQYEVVREMSRMFSRLHVKKEVRALFLDAEGEPIFHGEME